MKYIKSIIGKNPNVNIKLENTIFSFSSSIHFLKFLQINLNIYLQLHSMQTFLQLYFYYNFLFVIFLHLFFYQIQNIVCKFSQIISCNNPISINQFLASLTRTHYYWYSTSHCSKYCVWHAFLFRRKHKYVSFLIIGQ